MKYLYVLVHSETGFYLEQTYVSMLSLKHVMPNASISLIVDDATDKITNNTFFCSIKTLITEYKVISLPTEMSATAKSRYIKTSMRQYIDGNFLYIDSDTIWASPINEKDFTFDIMGVLDGHVPFRQNSNKDSIEKNFKKMNCFPNTEHYINGGVLFSRDSELSRDFFSQWHSKWLHTSQSGILIDQPSLNYVLNNIEPSEKKLLPGEYNSQIINSWNFFFNAKIIHYFTSVYSEKIVFKFPYLLHRVEYWEEFRKKHDESKIHAIVANPLSLFEKDIMIKGAAERDFEITAIYGFAKDIYLRKKNGQKSKFDLLEKTLALLSRITK